MPDLSMSLNPSELVFTQPALPAAALSSSKAGNAAQQAAQQKAQKASSAAAPRIDLEPLYANLKAAIPEYWPQYKEAVSLFLLGELFLQPRPFALLLLLLLRKR